MSSFNPPSWRFGILWPLSIAVLLLVCVLCYNKQLFEFNRLAKPASIVNFGNISNKEAFDGDKFRLTGTIEDTIIAKRCLEKARALIDSLDFDQALQYAKRSADLMKSLVGENHLNMIDEWEVLATAYLRENKLDSAEIFCIKAIHLNKSFFGRSNLKMASLLQTMGDIKSYNFLGQEDALNYYNQSLSIRLEVATEHKHLLLIAESYRHIGKLYERFEDYSNSLEYLNESLELSIKQPLIDTFFTADIYYETGIVHCRRNDLEKAKAYLEKAIHLYGLFFSLEHPKVALCYHALGTLCQNNRLYSKALEYHRKALAIRSKYYGTNYIYNAGTFQNMGNIYGQAMGQYDRGLLYLLKARAIFLDFYGPETPALIGVNLGIGEMYANKGKYSTAEHYYQLALDKQIEIYGLDISSIADIYNKMGELAFIQSKYREALQFIKKSMNILATAGKQEEYYNMYFEIGKVHLKTGDFDGAITNLNLFLDYVSTHPEMLKKSPIFIGMANCYLHLARSYIGKKKLNTAYFYLQEALKYLICCPENKVEGAMENVILVDILNEKAGLEWLLYKEQQSEKYLYKSYHSALLSLEGVEYLKSSFQSIADRKALLNYAYTAYQNTLLMQHTLHERTDSIIYLYKAFKTLEQSKSYFLREALREFDFMRAALIPDSLLERETLIKLNIDNLRKEQFQALLNLKSEAEKDLINTRFTSRIFDFEAKLDSIHDAYQSSQPGYLRKFNNTVISLKEVQHNILSNGEAILEYFVGDSLLFIYAVKKDTLQFLKINKDFPLDDLVNDMRNGILNYSSYEDFTSKEGASTRQYVKAARALYQQLFEPIEVFIEQNDHLIIIPDGVMNYIPFDALISKPIIPEDDYRNHSYLLHDYSISLNFSTTVLYELRHKEVLENPVHDFAAFAPVFDGDTSLLEQRAVDYSNSRSLLGPLKYNIPEVKTIRNIVGGKLFLGTDATEDQFVQHAGKYKVLHLSTHAKANDNPDFSFVAFYQTPEDSIENEWLYNQEVYRLRLNTDLLVLSACETGIGELQKGEGVVSLSRGFSQAGVKSQVTSLWNVNDEATGKLMKLFYQNLKKGMQKDVALQKAKQDYLENDPLNAPYYWAGFVPIGDMSPITFSETSFSFTYLLLIGFILGVFVLISFVRFKREI